MHLLDRSRTPGKRFKNELTHNNHWLKIGGALLFISTVLLTFGLVNDEYLMLLPIGFIIAAFVMFTQALKFWPHKWVGMLLHIGAGLVDTWIAIAYFVNSYSMLYLALWFLAFSFLFAGVFRIYTAMNQGMFYLGWEWTFLCGIVNLLLVLSIALLVYPLYTMVAYVSALDFFFTGLALFLLGFGADQLLPERKTSNHRAHHYHKRALAPQRVHHKKGTRYRYH